jgi:sec-independent protein translocase protein TatC
MIGVLDRFRSKLLVILLMFIIITPVAFYFSDILLYYINKPFIESGNKLNIFTLMGGFMLKFKVSVAAALFVLVPFIIYQLWSVVLPTLNITNRMFSRLSIISAVILFYSGVAFVFFLLLPAAVKVMLGFVGKDMLSTIGADNYLGFILFLSISMGVLFEVPVIVLVLTRMGLISPAMLSGKRKYAIVIIWIIAAIITPQPDPLSQAMVGVPLMIIYEISILLSRLVARSNLKRISYR